MRRVGLIISQGGDYYVELDGRNVGTLSPREYLGDPARPGGWWYAPADRAPSRFLHESLGAAAAMLEAILLGSNGADV